MNSSQKVLDVGCGTGLVTRILSELAQKRRLPSVVFHAFDLTPAMIQVFQKWILSHKKRNISARQADVLELHSLPKDWKNYDLIVTSGVLEYLPKKSLNAALKNLRALLEVNGRMLIFITRHSFLTKWLIKKWWKAETFTKEEMQNVLEGAGFRSILFKKFPFPYGYLNGWGMVIEAR